MPKLEKKKTACYALYASLGVVMQAKVFMLVIEFWGGGMGNLENVMDGDGPDSVIMINRENETPKGL